jgi:hypothetical protein
MDKMDTFLAGVGAVIVVAVAFFALIVLGPLVGMLAGWACTLIGLEGIIRTGFAALSLAIPPDVPLWVVGGALGFIGGFFKSSTATNKTK